MFKVVITASFALILGILGGLGIIYLNPDKLTSPVNINIKQNIQPANKEVWGFLPYWFLGTAREDYSGYITTLTYFSLSPDADGTILKYNNPGEFEPGYYALTSGSFNKYFENAKKNNIKLSIAIFGSDQEKIENMLKNPEESANNLANDTLPLMQEYGFTDLNLDIESITDATPEMQSSFERFVSVLQSKISSKNFTLSIDIASIDFFKDNRLIKPSLIEQYVDKIILMAYDYHYPGSFVTGPVSPLYGAESEAEFDSHVAVKEVLKTTPKEKLILGLPFYGYSWETIDTFPRAATIPTTAIPIGNSEVEELLSTCTNCTKGFDKFGQESYVTYKTDTGTYQQIFYGDETSTQAKVNYANENGLAGLAVWALGYEASSGKILTPLKNFLSHY